MTDLLLGVAAGIFIGVWVLTVEWRLRLIHKILGHMESDDG